MKGWSRQFRQIDAQEGDIDGRRLWQRFSLARRYQKAVERRGGPEEVKRARIAVRDLEGQSWNATTSEELARPRNATCVSHGCCVLAPVPIPVQKTYLPLGLGS